VAARIAAGDDASLRFAQSGQGQANPAPTGYPHLQIALGSLGEQELFQKNIAFIKVLGYHHRITNGPINGKRLSGLTGDVVLLTIKRLR